MSNNIQLSECAFFNDSLSMLFLVAFWDRSFFFFFPPYEFISVIYYGITKFQLALFYQLKFNES